MKLALFIHLVAFALGFGAVLLVDIIGALWVARRVKKLQLLWVSSIVQKVIWVSVVLLVISGGFLLPETLSPRTKLKLTAVLFLIANGFVLDRLHKLTEQAKADDFWALPRNLQLMNVAAITLSQLLWWTAVIIGFLNSSSHTL